MVNPLFPAPLLQGEKKGRFQRRFQTERLSVSNPMKDPRTLFFRKGALGWIVCLVFLSHLTKLPAQTSTPYQNDFETADGFISGNPGELPEWLFSPEVLPSLNSDAASGLQSLSLLGDGSVSIDFLQDIGASIGWVDFYLKPTISLETDLPVTIAPTQAAITGFVDFGTNGSIFAIDGDGLGSGSWFDTLSTFDLSGNQANQWMRLSYRLDSGDRIAVRSQALRPRGRRFQMYQYRG